MPDISRTMALEIADNWDVMAAREHDPLTTRRETLRECADLVRMLANIGEPVGVALGTPSAPAPTLAGVDELAQLIAYEMGDTMGDARAVFWSGYNHKESARKAALVVLARLGLFRESGKT